MSRVRIERTTYGVSNHHSNQLSYLDNNQNLEKVMSFTSTERIELPSRVLETPTLAIKLCAFHSKDFTTARGI